MAEDWFDIKKIKGAMKKAASSPVPVAFGVGVKPEDGMLAMHLKRSPEFLVKALKKEGFKPAKILVGTARTEGPVLVVTCEAEVPKSIKSVRYFLKENQLVQKKVRLIGPNGEFGADDDGEGQDTEEAVSQPAASDDGQEAFKRRFAQVTPRVKKALAELGAGAKPVGVKFKQAHTMGQNGDYGGAMTLLDELEELIDNVPADSAQNDALAAEWNKRLGGLVPQIKEVLTAKLEGSRDIALKFKEAQDFKSKQDYAQANKLLDLVEQLLKNSATNNPATSTADSAKARERALADAMSDWKARRGVAVSSLKAVAGMIAGAKHASSTKAILEIQAVIKNLTNEPATLQQVNELRKWLGTDAVVNDVCELAEDVRTPLMIPLERMHELLTATA